MTDPVTDWAHTRTDRLWLDLPTLADVDELHAIHADEATWRHLPSARHTSRHQSVEMVEQGLAQWAGRGLGYWSVRDNQDGPVIGRGGCAVPAGCPWWNLYYRLSAEAHGQGYATEMSRAAVEAAHEVDPDLPVLAYLLEHNLGSRRTAERLGLHLVWRGPDEGNPDPSAVRLVFTDRDPSPEVLRRLGTPG